LLLAIFLAAMDQTVVSIALLAIAADLGEAHLMAWLVSGYLVAATVTAPLYGKLSDIHGRRAMMLVAIGLYLVASIGCALAQSMSQLILGRIMQGIGGGGLLVLSHAAIADVVPGAQRGRYQGYFSGVFAVAALGGPVIGGFLAEYASWRTIFWLNLPLGMLAWFMVERRLRGLPVTHADARIDWSGAVLLVAGLVLVLVALARIGQGQAWSSAGVLAGLAGGLVLVALFVWHQFRTIAPIIAPSLMLNRTVMRLCLVLALMFFVLYGCAVLLPLAMQTLEQLSPAEVAWRMLPHTLATPLGAFAAGRLMLTWPRYRSLIGGGAALTALGLGMVELYIHWPSLGWPFHALAITIAGFGLGLTMPAAMVAIQGAVPRGEIGVATAVSSFFRQLGGAVGIAVLTAVLFASMAPLLTQRMAKGSAAQVLIELTRPGDSGLSATEQTQRVHTMMHSFDWTFGLCMAAALLGLALSRTLPKEPIGSGL
jgi:EmrB/QacA subfamily drug resistance transporter